MSLNKSQKDRLIIDKLPGYFLIACLVAVLGYLVYLLSPILTAIFVGAVLAITFNPFYEVLERWFRGRKGMASFVACLIVVSLSVVMLTTFTLMIAEEAKDTYDLVETQVTEGKYDHLIKWQEGGFFYDLAAQFGDVVDVNELDLKGDLVSGLGQVTSSLSDAAQFIFSGIYNLVIGVLIMFFAMFYFFRDSEIILAKIKAVSPLPDEYEEKLFDKVKDIVKSVMLGIFLTALVQGVVGGIGFAIIGISSPVFWSAVFAIFSLVPIFGTALVWGPAALLLFANGSYGSAVFILIWGVLVIGMVDNLLRPLLIQGKGETYFPLMFFLIFGGFMTMGLSGVIVAPVMLVILMSFLHIYEIEYSKFLKK